MTEQVFWFFGVVAILSALLVVVIRSPIASAFWLISTMLRLSAIFFMLHAPFVGAMQILVYAGAVMVLFLFVIMLLNLGQNQDHLKRAPGWFLAVVLVGVMGSQLIPLSGYTRERMAYEFSRSAVLAEPALMFDSTLATSGMDPQTSTAERGVLGGIAKPLFEQYLVPFELTSFLMLAAIVGAVVLAKRRI